MTNISEAPRPIDVPFIAYYWKAFLWGIVAVGAIIGLVALYSIGWQWLVGGVAGLIPLALVRSQMAGWDVSGFAADGEGVIGCLGGVLVITLAVLWPLAELYRQRDFLLRAQTAWEGGLVFVHKDSGKPRRAD
ncbi:MAG: hypothetical protein ACOYL5_08090 [Phototrophicaceae bacterium]|jgi:hypothetical protein